MNQPPVGNEVRDIAAFEEVEDGRLAAAQGAIARLIAAKGPRSIENTLVPYDEAISQLNAASYLSDLVQKLHPDARFRDQGTQMNTRASAAMSALALNRQVYLALAAIDLSNAEPATAYYVRRQLLEFRLAGVDRDLAARERLKSLNELLSQDESAFERNIADGTKSVEVTDASEFDGLPQDFIDRHKRGADGRIRISTSHPDLFAVLKYANSDRLRRELWQAWRTRAYPQNRDVLRDMMRVRFEIATAVGYSSWAQYNAADKMIGNAQNQEKFIEQLRAAARPAMQREFSILLAEKRKSDPQATEIFSHELMRLSELVRRSRYDFDSRSLRPYLAYESVKQGIMATAAALFRVGFRQQPDAPAWDPSVETWLVLEGDRVIGRFYLDMHPRAGKSSGAQMIPVLDGIRGKQLPEAALACNFSQPSAGEPGLMDYAEVVTFFHEFGHLMHHILGGGQRWAGISGVNVETDFVEAPSQMLEEWMHSPQVLASFARHYKTGEPIPLELVERMNRAAAFGRAGYVGSQIALAAVSYAIYDAVPSSVDLEETVLEKLRRYTLLTPLAADARLYASFEHLGGYSSAYYAYMFDKVIAEDFFARFDRGDLRAGDVAMRYRRAILEPGGSMSGNEMVRSFLGRPQDTVAFERWLNEEFAGTENDDAVGSRK